MSDKNKNIKSSLHDLLRYNRNELSGAERNSFERELQKDPFLSEASEGYESLSPEEAINDITELQRSLEIRKGRKQRFIFYRIAASITILMILSAVYVFVSRSKDEKQLAENSVKSPTFEIAKNLPVVAAVDSKVSNTKNVVTPEIKAELSSSQGRSKEVVRNISTDEKTKADITIITDTTPLVRAEPEKAYAAEKRLAAPVAAIGKNRAMEQDKEDILPDYIPPQPVNGKDNFDKYVNRNLHRPDSTTNGQRVVVVVSFLVRVDGNIDSIKIIRSPQKSFSDEAIRVIKEGPAWKPAYANGRSVEDEVRVRIVFH
jgi:hypothetical protein